MEAINLKNLTDAQVDSKVNHFKRIIHNIEFQIRSTKDASLVDKLKKIQIEYCYAKRESETRSDRRVAHRGYIKKP